MTTRSNEIYRGRLGNSRYNNERRLQQIVVADTEHQVDLFAWLLFPRRFLLRHKAGRVEAAGVEVDRQRAFALNCQVHRHFR